MTITAVVVFYLAVLAWLIWAGTRIFFVIHRNSKNKPKK